MAKVVHLLPSPAACAGLAAALSPPARTGFATWPSMARGRLASTLSASAAAGVAVYMLVSRLPAPATG